MKPLLLLYCLTMLPASALNEERASGSLSHVVLMWLNEPGNQQAIDKITAASYAFRDIPGVASVKVGSPVASERPIVDDSFNLGIIITFPNREAMQSYLLHPIHKEAVHDIIKPLVKKILVYDINE